MTADGKTISKNEQYLIKKLRASSISIDRIDLYLVKLKGDDYQEEDESDQKISEDEKFRRLVLLSAANQMEQ